VPLDLINPKLVTSKAVDPLSHFFAADSNSKQTMQPGRRRML
jgi:hypothetical protein